MRMGDYVPRATLFPCCQTVGVVPPWNESADGVALHPVKVGNGMAVEIKVLAPQELSVQRHRRLGMLPFGVPFELGSDLCISFVSELSMPSDQQTTGAVRGCNELKA